MRESDRPSQGATILIIEGDDSTATDLQTGLSRAGYVVRRAASADEALATLGSTRADLILISLMLPGTDGLILCATLKKQFPAPILMLSARPCDVDRALALESGAVGLLSVPVDVDEFLTLVRGVVETRVPAR